MKIDDERKSHFHMKVATECIIEVLIDSWFQKERERERERESEKTQKKKEKEKENNWRKQKGFNLIQQRPFSYFRAAQIYRQMSDLEWPSTRLLEIGPQRRLPNRYITLNRPQMFPNTAFCPLSASFKNNISPLLPSLIITCECRRRQTDEFHRNFTEITKCQRWTWPKTLLPSF